MGSGEWKSGERTMLRGCDGEWGVEKRRGDDVERAQEGGRTGQGGDWKGENKW